MVTGFFDKTPLARSMANVECNAVSCVAITQLFLSRMLTKGLRGGIVFTSSAAACQPCPFSALCTCQWSSFLSSHLTRTPAGHRWGDQSFCIFVWCLTGGGSALPWSRRLCCAPIPGGDPVL